MTTKYPIRCKNTIGYFTMNQHVVLDHNGYPMYFGKLIDQNDKVVGGWKCFFKTFPLHPVWWDRNGKKHFAGSFSNHLATRILDILNCHQEECPF